MSKFWEQTMEDLSSLERLFAIPTKTGIDCRICTYLFEGFEPTTGYCPLATFAIITHRLLNYSSTSRSYSEAVRSSNTLLSFV